GQSLAMIFDKSSARTRISFEVGMYQLGGHALFINGSEIQIGKRESVGDTAKVLSRFVQGIMIRTYAHSIVEGLAENSTVPIINGLTDSHHPCQVLADLQTIREKFKKLKGLQLVYVGDGNNMTHSLMIGAAKTGMHCRAVCPKGYEPDAAILKVAQAEGKKTGSRIEVTHQVQGSAKGADVVYTDVWASMGQESEKEKRVRDFQGYQVNGKLMAECPKAIFLHCLPAHRGEEVSAGVIDGKQSMVWDQAENRLHAQKAVLVTLMGKRGKS
ncbi:MAG TPA: ornithine carbamoyltransferase, partial [bacterium]|nr:ornithine carbamoyltransferase [bacterium]